MRLVQIPEGSVNQIGAIAVKPINFGLLDHGVC
jgi:hypothetical protein